MMQLMDELRRALAGAHTVVLPATPDGSHSVVPAERFDPAGTDREPPALVVRTSGTTGEPKAAALSARALRASAAATEAELGGPSRWYLTLPTHHIAGVQVILRAMHARTVPFAGGGPFRAERFVRDIDAIRTASLHGGAGPLCTSLVPTQLSRILDDARATDAAREFQAILVGGAAISPRLLERAQQEALPVVRTYGMSETGGGCVYDGRPFDGVRITIGTDSRISITGPVVADGYVRITDRGLTALTDDEQPGFDIDPATGQRRFTSSDLGSWDDGVLSVLGRTDDVFICGGENISPLAVENTLLTALEPLGAAEVLIAPLPDEQWGMRPVLLIRPGENGLRIPNGQVCAQPPAGVPTEVPVEPIRQHIRHGVVSGVLPAMPAAGLPFRAFAVTEIPTRGIGKPDRRAAASLVTALAAGAL